MKNKKKMMVGGWLFFVMLMMSHSAEAQVTFPVRGFSDKYRGEVFIADTSEVFSPGWVAIYNQRTGEELIKEESDELTFSLHDGNLEANVLELPYGEQSAIIYNDFNFDGKKDFAIMDGQNSCYHGPSFQIYLATENGFERSPEFTRLAQEYCGMFDVDNENKTLHTMTKSGCCWHQFSTFIVENNKPKAIEIVEEDNRDFAISTLTIERWNGKKMVKTSQRTIDLEEEGIKTVLSFRIPKKNKDVVLYNINDRTLNYVLVDKDGNVEFAYPIETIYKNPDFVYRPQTQTLTFKNEDATYCIYLSADKVGIEITVGKKKYVWKGNRATVKGSLKTLFSPRLDNVVFK